MSEAPTNMMRVVSLSLVALVLSGLTWALVRCSAICVRFANREPGIMLEDRVMLPNESVEDFVEARVEPIKSRRVYLDTEDELVPRSLGELGIEIDVTRTIEEARRVAAPRSLRERAVRVFLGPPLHLPMIAPTFTLDAQKLRSELRSLGPRVFRAPVNAALDLNHHRRIAAVAGRELDLEATVLGIANAKRDEGSVYPLVYRSIPASIDLAELPTVDVTQILGSFETDFTQRAGARAVNIRRGAQLLDGSIIQPGAVFSFNRVVGPRTARRGFIDAPVIVRDEIDKGLGGGICQVASTLHAAAVYGGLPIIERRSHSRPSGYAPLGLDATVIDGKVDLRFQNPFDAPLMIHATLPTRTTLRVELLGRRPEGPVEHQAHVVKRYPFYRRIVEKTELLPGDFRRSQKGTYGYDIVSVVTHTRSDGSRAARRYASKYYPVPEVFWVSPGTLPGSLPPLPDGAEGLETESPSALPNGLAE